MSIKGSLWLLVTAAAVGSLAVGARHQPPKNAGFDQPGAAAWHELQRRLPVNGGDMPVLYDQASASLSRLQRFASRINRTIPAA